MADEFERALRLLRRRHPQLAEDGFARLRAVAGEHVDRLIDEYRAETDHDVRSRLLDLIVETGSPRALDLLATPSRGADERPGT